MKFSEGWLRELVDAPAGTEALVAQLTAAGLEVDDVEPVAPPLDGIVVARVAAVDRHPDSDRLSLCEVDAGGDERLTVVCGAPNVRAGLCTPLAPVGTRLPGGMKIRRSRIRGVESNGMLCSAVELGLGEEADRILDLGDDAPVGARLTEHLALDDHTIDIDLTPNRGDCLGVEGVAREVATLSRSELRPVEVPAVAAAIEETFPIRLEAAPDCPRYVGRLIRGIDPRAETPAWMKERLRRCGARPISPVVDVTNYVMLELGQPLHAFDFDRLTGGIVVRRARDGEPLTLLDGQRLELDAEALVIADHEGAVALAGVMGGLDSAVTIESTNIFLESAWFAPPVIADGARRNGLHTDASHRFERAVSPDLQRRACERATALLLSIVGGEAGPVIDECDAGQLPRPAPIRLRASRARRLLGIEVAGADVEDILTRLGCEVETLADGEWQVTPPAFRADLAIEADLIEELIRVTGYDELPLRAPLAPLEMRPRREASHGASRLREMMVGRGYREAITYSFVDPRLQKLLDPGCEPIPLSNPISSDLAVMRTSMWPGLVAALRHNLNRQQTRVRLFEIGLVFRRAADGTVAQTPRLGALAAGARFPEQWGLSSAPIDFHDLRADLDALASLAGMRLEVEADAHPALHPGQSAAIRRDGRVVGHLGALHPAVSRTLKVAVPVVLLEIDVAAVAEGRLPEFRPLLRYPAVRRDIAVVVDEQVTMAALRDCVGQAAVDVLQNLELFDLYRGEGIDPGKKSLAIGLIFQNPSRTLEDHEVDASVAGIVDALRERLGAELRG